MCIRYFVSHCVIFSFFDCWFVWFWQCNQALVVFIDTINNNDNVVIIKCLLEPVWLMQQLDSLKFKKWYRQMTCWLRKYWILKGPVCCVILNLTNKTHIVWPSLVLVAYTDYIPTSSITCFNLSILYKRIYRMKKWYDWNELHSINFVNIPRYPQKIHWLIMVDEYKAIETIFHTFSYPTYISQQHTTQCFRLRYPFY